MHPVLSPHNQSGMTADYTSSKKNHKINRIPKPIMVGVTCGWKKESVL
jgi:hypothetical protein